MVKIEGDEEVNCNIDWSDENLKRDVMMYFKSQLFLLSDICYKNAHLLGPIKDMFQVPAIIHNLASPGLDLAAKIGLAKMLTSLFQNTENLIFVRKPRLQLEWAKDSLRRGRASKYMTIPELEQMRDLIHDFFAKSVDPDDPSLHCEFLRFLSYLIHCDFVFSDNDSGKDWERQMQTAYKLLSRAFCFSARYLEVLNSIRHGDTISRGNTRSTFRDDEDQPQLLKVQTVKSEDLIKDARMPYGVT